MCAATVGGVRVGNSHICTLYRGQIMLKLIWGQQTPSLLIRGTVDAKGHVNTVALPIGVLSTCNYHSFARPLTGRLSATPQQPHTIPKAGVDTKRLLFLLKTCASALVTRV